MGTRKLFSYSILNVNGFVPGRPRVFRESLNKLCGQVTVSPWLVNGDKVLWLMVMCGKGAIVIHSMKCQCSVEIGMVVYKRVSQKSYCTARTLCHFIGAARTYQYIFTRRTVLSSIWPRTHACMYTLPNDVFWPVTRESVMLMVRERACIVCVLWEMKDYCFSESVQISKLEVKYIVKYDWQSHHCTACYIY